MWQYMWETLRDEAGDAGDVCAWAKLWAASAVNYISQWPLQQDISRPFRWVINGTLNRLH